MTQSYIPSWGIKDPNDIRPKNYDFAKVLLDAGSPVVDAFEVSVTEAINLAGETVASDGALVIAAIVWDSVSKRISFRWSGGTLGWKYLVTARIKSGDTFSADQSAWVTIAHK